MRRVLAALAAGAAPATLATGSSSSSSSSSEAPVDAETCVWPQCTTRCGVKCDYSPVGSCAASLVTHTFPGCAAYRGSTECFMGKCLCQEGFCASADGESCEPEVCIEGALAPRYEKTDWVRTFFNLASSDSFPPPGTTEHEAGVFLRANALWPAVLVALGLVVGTVTFVCLCCSPGMSEERDLRASRRPVRPGPRSERYARLPREELQDEPSVCPMLSVAGATLVLNAILIVQRFSTYNVTASIADETMDHMLRDITTVEQQASVINHTVRDLEYRLRNAPMSCRGVGDEAKQAMMDKAARAMGQYCDKAEELYKQIKPLPAQVQDAQDYAHEFFPWLKWGPILPVLVMTLANAFMVLEAILTRVCGTSTLAREEDFAMHVAALLFFLVIVFVAAISAAEVGVGIAASLFCDNVDDNILQYGAFYLTNHTDIPADHREMMINLTTFYVSGGLPNPLSTKTMTLKKYFKAIYEYYATELVQDNKEAPSAICPALGNISAREVLLPAKYTLHNMSQVLRASNIYPYYDGVVHKIMCGSVIATLGWTVVTQTIVGLICFPACAVLTHRFLSSWAVWKSRAEQAREDFLGDAHEAAGKLHGDDAEGFSSESDDEEHCWPCWGGGRRGGGGVAAFAGEARDSRELIAPAYGQGFSH
mmetsp:Transcript_31058/g.83302  ORF Transcript_31058/g.83302 Transcript_31058/m.83302 type:complete len:652 (+) Transcript_31058:75-2030(+)